MPSARLLKPTEGPTGDARLLTELRRSLLEPSYTRARFAVAFAKRGGVARLIPAISALRARGGRLEVIVGIDSGVTSLDAIELLGQIVDQLYITHEPSVACSFHPKLYLFDGPGRARAFVGSQNLTVGGLELNYEAGVVVDFELPADRGTWADFDAAWAKLLPPHHANTVSVTPTVIADLVATGELLPENATRTRTFASPTRGHVARHFAGIPIAPPTPLPPGLSHPAPPEPRLPLPVPASQADTLLIEVRPHANAEVFLSKRALDQNPRFFAWPWTGETTPKRAEQPTYPRREPSPVVGLRIYDQHDNLVFNEVIRPWMVLYQRKAEVRITIGQEAARHVPAFSLLVLREPLAEHRVEQLDYEMEIYPEGSPTQQRLVVSCDQLLPAGGETRARRMGWL